MKVMVLGDGLLGNEIVKQTRWDSLSRKKDGFDLRKNSFMYLTSTPHDVIVNCVAYTDTYSNDRDLHWKTNYEGVAQLVTLCNDRGKKLVHISTDYIYANSDNNAREENTVPVHANNWYSYTKLLGDAHVQLKSRDYLIVRCSHKPNPFPYEEAWIDQVGNFDYVDRIASLIIKLVEGGATGVYNVGTELKSIKELSQLTKETRPTFSPLYVPKNVSMDITKMKNFIEKL